MEGYFIIILLCAACFAEENEEKKTCDRLVLTRDSKDRDWFDITFDPNVPDAKVDQLLFGNSWGKKPQDIASFKVETNQKIIIAAHDGISFSVKEGRIKVINADDFTIKGLYGVNDVEFDKTIEPKKEGDRWERVKFKARENQHIIYRLELEVRLNNLNQDTPSREFLRDLYVEVVACKETAA